MTLRRRILLGGGATVLGQVSSTIAQVLSVPLFLGFWGVDLYGAWIVLSTIPIYFGMSDIGFGSAAGNEMTMRVAAGDREGALAVFRSTWVFVTSLSALVFTAAISLIWLFPVERWLGLTVLGHPVMAWTVTLLLAHAFVHMQGSVLSGAYRAVGLYARSTLFGSLVRIVEFGVVAGAVAAGGGPVSAALGFLVSRLAGQVMYYCMLRAREPWISFGLQHASIGMIRRLASPAVAFMGFPLGYAITGQGIVTVIGASLGADAVVVFSTVRTVVNAVRSGISVVNSTVWPELSMAFGSNDLPLARVLHQNACKAALWIAVLGAGMLVIGGEWIVRVWTNGKVTPDPLFLQLMVVGTIGYSIWSTSLVVPSASNRHQRMVIAFVLASALALLSGVGLARTSGLTGAAMSLLIVDLLMCGLVLRNSLTLLGDRWDDFLVSQFRVPRFRQAPAPHL